MPEEYTTLYRAFRPHRFCDEVCQKACLPSGSSHL